MNDDDNMQAADGEATEDQLAQLPPERLVQMLREKRRSEGNYRAQLREVEEERDRLSEAVSGYQRAAFDDFARSRRVQDSAVDDVAEKLSVGDLLDESGRLDEEKAGAALEELRREKPHYFQPIPQSNSADFTGSSNGLGLNSALWGDILAH